MSSITIGKLQIDGTNHQELLSLKKEIFGESRYFVNFNKPDPVIIDGGAHVGLAAIYFKSLWPQAHITCIEPLPQNVELLKHNLWVNKFDDVKVVELALAEQEGERTLFADKTEDQWYSTASVHDGAWNHTQKSLPTKVSTIPLKSLLSGPVDLLKLDIEGMESVVLTAAASRLNHVHHLIFEYHPHPKNSWHKLISVLNRCGFTTQEKISEKSPSWLKVFYFINTRWNY